MFCSPLKQFLNLVVASISITDYWASENLKVTIVAQVNLPTHVCVWWATSLEVFVGLLIFDWTVPERLAKCIDLYEKPMELHETSRFMLQKTNYTL